MRWDFGYKVMDQQVIRCWRAPASPQGQGFLRPQLRNVSEAATEDFATACDMNRGPQSLEAALRSQPRRSLPIQVIGDARGGA